MKTLNAKGGFAYNFAFTGLIGAVMIALGIFCLFDDYIDGFRIMVIAAIMFNLLTVFSGINAYRQNSVTYGNGKIIIKHVGREYVDDVAVGAGRLKRTNSCLKNWNHTACHGISWDIPQKTAPATGCLLHRRRSSSLRMEGQ
ncbi:MAG: hypothetical protein NC313_16750 [Butyrivibrio sp.]|nr:hypothetical protein [Butyrivibrio sp.]